MYGLSLVGSSRNSRLYTSTTMAEFLDMVVVRANGEGVPIIFHVGSDGEADVLSLRFQLKVDSIHVDEDIYDPQSGYLTHTIGQMPISIGNTTSWKLKPGRYRAYGVAFVGDPSSNGIELLPHTASTSFQTPPVEYVKVEQLPNKVTVLSSDSDAQSPKPSLQGGTPSSASDLHTNPSLISVSTPKPHVSNRVGVSVLDCLRGLRILKGCRNVLSKLDYDNIPVHRVTVLPPSFNGNVIFELPAVDSAGASSHAKQMAGMDKRYDGHAWSKTVTTNIVNRMGLSFRKSVCLGHLRCVNSKCKFLNRAHWMKDVNELE